VDHLRYVFNEAVPLHPMTSTCVSRRGIDSCCGGALPIRVAAERHRLELEGLLEALRQAADEDLGSGIRP
jgi:iron-sulfur cluster repair protein YtfE (RIC family)